LANWQQHNEEERIEDANLYISEIFVDEGRQLKRLRPAPQGRGHRIRKRSNHVTLKIDTKVEKLGKKTTEHAKQVGTTDNPKADAKS
jgi:large subunit ribosomal protein L22